MRTRDYLIGICCTLILTALPYYASRNANQEISACFKQRAARAQILRSGLRDFGDAESWSTERKTSSWSRDSQGDGPQSPLFRRTMGLGPQDVTFPVKEEEGLVTARGSVSNRASKPSPSRRGTESADFATFRTPGGIQSFIGGAPEADQARRFSEIARHRDTVDDSGVYHAMADYK